MRKPNLDSKYFTICVYVFFVIAVTVLTLFIGINLNKIFSGISSFINAAKCIIYGLIIAYFINYILKIFERFVFRFNGHPFVRRLVSLIFSYITLSLLIIGFLFLIIPEIVNNYDSLVVKLKNVLETITEKLQGIVSNPENLLDFTILSADIERFIHGLLDVSGQFLKEIGNIVIGFILSFYVLLRKEHILKATKSFVNFIMPKKVSDVMFGFAKTLDNVFGRYFMGTILVSVIIGVVTLIVMLCVRIPYAYLVALIVGVTNVIPYFGPFLGAVPGFIIIFTADPIKAIWFAIIILIIQQLDGNFFTPRVLGNSVGLSSLWIIIALMLFSGLFGILGMLIGVPIFTIIYNTIRDLTNRKLKKSGHEPDSDEYERLFISPSTTFAGSTDEKNQEKENSGNEIV